MKDVGGAGFAGNPPPFPGREWAAVDVDVGGPERHSPRYHETCLVLESVKESSAAAAVSKPGCVWLRVSIFKDLEKARRLSPGARGGTAGALLQGNMQVFLSRFQDFSLALSKTRDPCRDDCHL